MSGKTISPPAPKESTDQIESRPASFYPSVQMNFYLDGVIHAQ